MEKPVCIWPSCLTPAESEELIGEINRQMLGAYGPPVEPIDNSKECGCVQST